MVVEDGMAEGTAQGSSRIARVLCFESFLRRSVGSREQVPPVTDAPDNPFQSRGWGRPLSEKEILHRRTMLNHFQRVR
jgi:hypothetical protein